ncbi:MAG: PAS domain-containing sensor histidine kinase [Gemmatimonadaceae bacterium]
MNHTLPPDLFVGLMAMSSDAVVAVDEEQLIIFFNTGAERIFGYTAAEVGGLPLAMLLPERFRAAHSGHVRGFGAEHGQARQMGERQQLSGLRKNGEEFPAEASIQQIVMDGRHVYAAMLRDISPRQKAEDALRQAVKARDDMIGIVSHDLRNPANAVKMLANSIIAEGGLLPASVVERVGIIRQAAEQIDRLIQDLLDVTRLESGRFSVNPRPSRLADLIEIAAYSLRPLATSQGITLAINIDGGLPDVMADPDRITQVISNLVGNAVKFTLNGGRIEISARQVEEMMEVSVRDTGAGIPHQQLPHVFDRFYQAPGNSARRHGAGLGLPIARGIIEAHGGYIWVESAPGQGTTVIFVIPMAPTTA